jgi:hypothetical protein
MEMLLLCRYAIKVLKNSVSSQNFKAISGTCFGRLVDRFWLKEFKLLNYSFARAIAGKVICYSGIRHERKPVM